MQGRYDLAVAYRIYPSVSKPALGLPFDQDKYRQSEVCLRSFKQSLGSLRVKMWALLDGCPDDYETMFRRYVDAEDLVLIRLPRVGNQRTFSMQIDILLKQDDCSIVYFAEDDYFYLPDQLPAAIAYLTESDGVDFVSPYDHLDCYTMHLHKHPNWIRVHRSHHWRTAASTCLTFLTTKEKLKKCERVFRSFCSGNEDSSLWLSLTKYRVFNFVALLCSLREGGIAWKSIVKSWIFCWRQIAFGRRFRLWVPVPAIATHLDVRALSPTIDWAELMQGDCAPDAEPPHAALKH